MWTESRRAGVSASACARTAPGEHTVRVVKLTEALQSSLLVGGVRVYGGELLSRRRQRRAK